MLRELLLAEPDRTKHAAIKCREIQNETPSLARTSRSGNLDIELVSVRDAGKGALEVLFRAWQGNRQIGFGPDGSVDIERYVIHSPRYAVPDPAGPIIKSFPTDATDGPNAVTEKRYREDMREALLRDIEHTISVKKQKVVGSRNIVPGKIGSSTATFFSGAGDGWVDNTIGAHGTEWDLNHDSTSGTSADHTGEFVRVRTGRTSGGLIIISRAFFPIAVTGLGTITSATLNLDTVDTNVNQDNDGDDFFVVVGATTQASTTEMVVGDFDTCGAVDSPTEWSDRIDWSDIETEGTYTAFTINAAGLAAIVNDTTWLAGVREGHDVIDSPYVGVGTSANQKRFETSETADTTSDPKLVVEHTAGAAGGNLSRLLLMGVG